MDVSAVTLAARGCSCASNKMGIISLKKKKKFNVNSSGGKYSFGSSIDTNRACNSLVKYKQWPQASEVLVPSRGFFCISHKLACSVEMEREVCSQEVRSI